MLQQDKNIGRIVPRLLAVTTFVLGLADEQIGKGALNPLHHVLPFPLETHARNRVGSRQETGKEKTVVIVRVERPEKNGGVDLVLTEGGREIIANELSHLQPRPQTRGKFLIGDRLVLRMDLIDFDPVLRVSLDELDE